MTENLYDAQRYFPPKCRECPTLVGLIEDGYISPDEVSKAEVVKAIREAELDYNFEACPGPRVRELPNMRSIMCAAGVTLIKQ